MIIFYSLLPRCEVHRQKDLFNLGLLMDDQGLRSFKPSLQREIQLIFLECLITRKGLNSEIQKKGKASANSSL